MVTPLNPAEGREVFRMKRIYSLPCLKGAVCAGGTRLPPTEPTGEIGTVADGGEILFKAPPYSSSFFSFCILSICFSNFDCLFKIAVTLSKISSIIISVLRLTL